MYDNPAPPGFVSASARRAFAWRACPVLGVLAILGLPLVLILIMALELIITDAITGLRQQSDVPRTSILWEGVEWTSERGAVWADSFWSLEGDTLFLGEEPLRLQQLPLRSDAEPRDVAELPPMENPWLLAGGDRLWVLSEERTWFFKDDELTAFPEQASPGLFRCRPFLLDGQPAVVARHSQHETFLLRLEPESGRWIGGVSETRLAGWPEHPCGPLDFRVVVTGETLHTFCERDDGVHYLTVDINATQRAEEELVLDASVFTWAVLAHGGAPMLVESLLDSNDGTLRGWSRTADGWQETLRWPEVETASEPGSAFWLGLNDLEGDSRFQLIGYWIPEQLRFMTFEGGKLTDNLVFEGSQGPDPFFLLRNPSLLVGPVLPAGAMIQLLSLIAAVILARLAKRYRTPSASQDGAPVQLADLGRRGLAKMIDWLLLTIPGSLVGLWTVVVGSLFTIDSYLLLELSTLADRFFITTALCLLPYLVVLSILEGYLATTPGKWLMGLRVLGPGRRPCGLGRALLRNLLTLVDGLLNFSVGLCLAAFSERYQRLGDRLAGTVVVVKE